METEVRERRTFDRFTVDAASVKYLAAKGLGIFKSYSEHIPIKDMSQSGIRFDIDRYMGPGSMVEMVIQIPGHSKFRLRGNIRWISEYAGNPSYQVGVQFMPYGSGKDFNSFRDKDRLKSVVNTYLN